MLCYAILYCALLNSRSPSYVLVVNHTCMYVCMCLLESVYLSVLLFVWIAKGLNMAMMNDVMSV